RSCTLLPSGRSLCPCATVPTATMSNNPPNTLRKALTCILWRMFSAFCWCSSLIVISSLQDRVKNILLLLCRKHVFNIVLRGPQKTSFCMVAGQAKRCRFHHLQNVQLEVRYSPDGNNQAAAPFALASTSPSKATRLPP